MKKQLPQIVFLIPVVMLIAVTAWAQPGTGSATLDNSSVQVEPGTVKLIFSESLYLGPDADWEVHGTLEVWSRNIWIAPTARLHGTGKLIIHNPGENLFYEEWSDSPTRIDGNGGLPIGLDIELRNAHNLVFDDIADPGFGTENGTDSRAAALHIGGNFAFAVDGGDVLLNGHDLILSAEAGFTGYNSRRMVVTGNSTVGHVVKTFANTQPFVFPVGVDEGDYTPATLAPASTATLYVSVQDYGAAGIELPDAERGMDRIWHIFADAGVQTAYTLQHNTVTNGNAYVDDRAQIVQYAGGTNWLGDATVLEAQGIHTRADILTATGTAADGSWFTKYAFAEDVGPRAADDTAQAESGSAVQIDVLRNDEPGSSPVVVGSIRITQQPQHGTVTINADGSVTYTPDRGFVGADTFEYEVTDENGLTGRATVSVTVTPRKLRIPNVFTPNGDGQNDVFEIEGAEGVDRIEVIVVNRWGNEVYRNVDYRNDWDGGNLNEGTYYYSIVTHRGDVQERYTGWVLIKRL